MLSRRHIFLPSMMLLFFTTLLAVQLGCLSGELEYCDRTEDDHHSQTTHTQGQPDLCHQDFFHPLKLSFASGTLIASGAPPVEPDPATASSPNSGQWRLVPIFRTFGVSPGAMPLLA